MEGGWEEDVGGEGKGGWRVGGGWEEDVGGEGKGGWRVGGGWEEDVGGEGKGGWWRDMKRWLTLEPPGPGCIDIAKCGRGLRVDNESVEDGWRVGGEGCRVDGGWVEGGWMVCGWWV